MAVPGYAAGPVAPRRGMIVVMAACNACGRRFRIRKLFCSNCGVRQFTTHGQPIDDRDVASSGPRHSDSFSSDSSNDGPVLLSAADPSQARERGGGGSGEETSDASVKSGLNAWAVGLGLGLLGIVAWATLGMSPAGDGAAEEALISPTTQPRSESSIETSTTLSAAEVDDASPGIPFDLEESVSNRTSSGSSEAEYILRTSAGLTPMEAVGEEFGFSLVAGILAAPAFINPNDGTYTDVPLGPEGVSLLTENYAVRVARVDGMTVLTARELWSANSEPAVLLETNLEVGFFPGPNPDEVWLVVGHQTSRELLDLRVGSVIASDPVDRLRLQLATRPTNLFSPRAGGIYEQIGSSVTKLSDDFGVAASDDLLLVDRCDEQARCEAVWLDRQTLEPLDYPAIEGSLYAPRIDPTSRWLAVLDYSINKFTVVEIDTGRSVFEANGVWNAPEFSPNGQWLAVMREGHSFILVHLETGTEFTIDAGAPTWRSDESLVFFPPEYASGGPGS